MGLDRRHLHPAAGALVAAALLLLSARVPGAMAQEETDDESKFGYVPGSPNGPDRWAELNASWASCSAGRMQSPIDLSRDNATLVRFNRSAGRLAINGTVYYLKQLHWHTPSEHTIDGRRYDMELHLVHESAENKAAVIGVLYENSSVPDPFLKTLERNIERIRDTHEREVPAGVVDPNLARATGSVYYRYMGSLTTPPCTEGVVWTVFEKVRPVAKYQVKLLRDAVDDGYEKNARPLQAVNNRDIGIFRPKPYIGTKRYY
ncbi:unnamed protein product [Urochloa decumbens]|uniref:Carbonic anhydrase n=1 Tax=Urochloa decumbens TaxID=240449 RepID=A0ABC9BE29_9POAL